MLGPVGQGSIFNLMEIKNQAVTLDYRGRSDHAILDEIRELLLTKREDVQKVVALVDTGKFARKILVYAEITGLLAHMFEKQGFWVVTLYPPSCNAGKVILGP